MEWGPGYSRSELEAAQDRFDLRFPPDLFALLLERRPPGGRHDWTGDEEPIRSMLALPLDGLLFDVEHGLWWPEWGERPHSEPERAAIVTSVVSAAPKLIPIYSHRYIPEEPHERGNPVFSVSQSDIIFYGSDLHNYFDNEFSRPHRYEIVGEPKRIRFWSDAVERAWDAAYWLPSP
jgi:hypothetical protein